MKYIILEDHSPEGLASQVVTYLAQAWMCVGGVAVVRCHEDSDYAYWYFQAMVRR